ncbi:MAG: class II aldolase/adducin family protein [Spirochaetales bacterium]|nr:MAG: class II aldolase/adducin family protein [Spirochaetales bacterium]
MIMERIYGYGMTTTSGGNLSVKDREGNIWITPGSLDKGSLKADQMVCVKPDGTREGPLAPSSEFPFHQSVYTCRPDLHSVIHAHPPALASFSITGRIPDTAILPQVRTVCGEIGFAPYAIPGSRELADIIAAMFRKGHNAVIMENHSVVVGGNDILDAFRRFETLDFCARIHIHARSLGEVNLLSEEDLKSEAGEFPGLPELPEDLSPRDSGSGTDEAAVRETMCVLIRRAYDQMLFTSTQGTFSARLSGDSFLITPYGLDRKYLEAEDLVFVAGGRKEKNKTPSRSVLLHKAVYERNKSINAVMIAHPPHVMAYSVTGKTFNTRVMPESYVFLKDVPLMPFGLRRRDYAQTAAVFDDHPAALIANDCIIVTGNNLVGCFDRLEITEYIAHSLLWAEQLGSIRELPEKDLKVLRGFWK